MFRLSLISLTIAVLLPFAAQAGDAEAGKALYEPCIACHGPNAEGMPALNSPGLAGQSESYLMRQLWDFKKGNRGAAEGDTIGAQMRPMAMTLPDGQAIANLAAYLASLPPARDGFSPQQIDLGRYLFFDPLLSGDNSISCASCHHPDLGFSDGRPRSKGIGGAEVRRAAPSLWNVAFQKRLFWDARSATLEEQVTGPLYDSAEMGSEPAVLLAKIGENATYRRLFRDAFPGSEGPPTLQQLYRAIAAFQVSLISLNSRYDRYAHGSHSALSEQEIEGMNVFRSFVARCAECHTPPLFTNQQIAVIGDGQETFRLELGGPVPAGDGSRYARVGDQVFETEPLPAQQGTGG